MSNCYICGIETDKVHKFSKKPCCHELSIQCPGYHQWLSVKRKKLYRENPYMVEQMREDRKFVQQRPEIAEKKRQSMTILHNGTDEKSLEFQKNYAAGRIKYSERRVIKGLEFLKSIGIEDEKIPKDMVELRKFIHNARLYIRLQKKKGA
jgi:hypothetical protein